MKPQTILASIALFLAIIAFSGCVSIDEVRAVAQQAHARVEQLDSMLAQSQAALDAARLLAEATGNQAALDAVATAERVSVELRAALPVARDAAAAADQALAAAEANAGRRWWEVGISIALALAGAGGGIVQAVRARNWASLAAHGLQVAQQVKRSAEAQKADVSSVISDAEQWQRDHGVKSTVDEIRKKATHI